MWRGYAEATDALNRATGVVLGVFALLILVAMAVFVVGIWRAVLTATPTTSATPPAHLPVRVEIRPAGAAGPAVVVRNTSATRPLPDLRVSLTPARGGRAVEVVPAGRRVLDPGARVEVWATDLGGRAPAIGDVVRVWAAGTDDPPLEFTDLPQGKWTVS